MGKVTYAPGIEYVQGALAKPKKKDGHKCGDYLIRKADSYERSTPVTTNEVKQRNRFSAVAAAVAARAKDLSKISADQMAFAAQKDHPDGVKTMKAFLWKLEKEAYDTEHNG